jgi:uncharacterized damage-inducible protein DinB
MGGIHMDAKGYLNAAEMLDMLSTTVEKERWNEILIPSLGSLGRLFAHMVRVRDVYRDSLLTGRVVFPGTTLSRDADLLSELNRSRFELAAAITDPQVDKVYWSDDYFVAPDVICATAIQHEGIHQGQWFVALKQLGYNFPDPWKDWQLS